jgi:hypothetical protein
LVSRDRKLCREGGRADVLVWSELHIYSIERLSESIIERLDVYRRLIIKEDNQAISDVNQRDLFITNAVKVEDYTTINMDCKRLATLWLYDSNHTAITTLGQSSGRNLRHF